MADDLFVMADLVGNSMDLNDTEIRDLKDAAPFLAAIPAIPSSNDDVHQYTKWTGAPVVGFRAVNDGREHDHSVKTLVTVNLKILDLSWKVDVAVAEAYKGGPQALIAMEGNEHLKAGLFKLEQQLLLGTVDGDAAGFTGLPDSTDLDALADDMVINAAGTTAATASSVYLIETGGLTGLSAVFKGSGIALGDPTVIEVAGSVTGTLPMWYTPASSWHGMQLGGKFSVARICNLTEDSGKGLTDQLIYDALEAFPAGKKPNLCVMNRRSQGQLRASRTATNQTGAPAPLPTTVGEGIPVVVSDALINTEALVT